MKVAKNKFLNFKLHLRSSDLEVQFETEMDQQSFQFLLILDGSC